MIFVGTQHCSVLVSFKIVNSCCWIR